MEYMRREKNKNVRRKNERKEFFFFSPTPPQAIDRMLKYVWRRIRWHLLIIGMAYEKEISISTQNERYFIFFTENSYLIAQ